MFRVLFGAVEYWLFVIEDSWLMLAPDTDIERTRSVSVLKIGVRDKRGEPRSMSTRGVTEILLITSSGPNDTGDKLESEAGLLEELLPFLLAAVHLKKWKFFFRALVDAVDDVDVSDWSGVSGSVE